MAVVRISTAPAVMVHQGQELTFGEPDCPGWLRAALIHQHSGSRPKDLDSMNIKITKIAGKSSKKVAKTS
ncbi:hypothetical protein ACIBP6_28070 [Nonomuraea terrae]|uniref:hypothetical protein n=1 Tax=Nonomuraea terrae TaxID=2530383 RepID=UPI0037BB4DD3